MIDHPFVHRRRRLHEFKRVFLPNRLNICSTLLQSALVLRQGVYIANRKRRRWYDVHDKAGVWVKLEKRGQRDP